MGVEDGAKREKEWEEKKRDDGTSIWKNCLVCLWTKQSPGAHKKSLILARILSLFLSVFCFVPVCWT